MSRLDISSNWTTFTKTTRRISVHIFHIGGCKCSSALLPCYLALTDVTTVRSGTIGRSCMSPMAISAPSLTLSPLEQIPRVSQPQVMPSHLELGIRDHGMVNVGAVACGPILHVCFRVGICCAYEANTSAAMPATLQPPPRKQWYDKLADAILGDDDAARSSSSRSALICQKCFAHNGLVKESVWQDTRESISRRVTGVGTPCFLFQGRLTVSDSHGQSPTHPVHHPRPRQSLSSPNHDGHLPGYPRQNLNQHPWGSSVTSSARYVPLVLWYWSLKRHPEVSDTSFRNQTSGTQDDPQSHIWSGPPSYNSTPSRT